MRNTERYIKIDAWNKRKGHRRLRLLGKKTLHLALTFFLGVALATIYHTFVTNEKVQKTIESVCNNFGGDTEECKSNVGEFLETSDDEVQNNVNINGGGE